MLPVDTESEDYRFRKTLNEDVKLNQNVHGKWDISMQNGDYINVTGKSSLYNAIIIAIMTRFNELEDIPLYEDFGCRVHEVMKDHKSEKVFYNIEIFIANVLKEMRRIHEVNELIVTDKNNENYSVYFNVTSISDEIVSGEVEI